MKDERETKEKLLLSAKQEFVEKGYMGASLRNICKNAGVTTGALYFFFEDKEDLFAALVQEPLDRLYTVMMQHYNGEIEQLDNRSFENFDYSDDEEAANQIVHYLYQYYEEFQLVLTKSQGSRFENSVDRFVNITDQHYRRITDQYAQKLGIPKINDYLIHWMSHMQIDVFVHMLTHEVTEQNALSYMSHIMRYLTNGWCGILEISDRRKK